MLQSKFFYDLICISLYSERWLGKRWHKVRCKSWRISGLLKWRMRKSSPCIWYYYFDRFLLRILYDPPYMCLFLGWLSILFVSQELRFLTLYMFLSLNCQLLDVGHKNMILSSQHWKNLDVTNTECKTSIIDYVFIITIKQYWNHSKICIWRDFNFVLLYVYP